MQQHFLRPQHAPISDARHVHLEAHELLGFLEGVCESRTVPSFIRVPRIFALKVELKESAGHTKGRGNVKNAHRRGGV
jgi:hypothetical protein